MQGRNRTIFGTIILFALLGVFNLPANGDIEPLILADEGEAVLPVTSIVLFSTGVGYFQRIGEVDGNTSVDLFFAVKNINDLLKSLVLQDYGGGSVSSINYASREPISQILRTLSIDVGSNYTIIGLLNQLRGEMVELSLKAPESAKLTGTVIGTEQKVDREKRTVAYLNLLAPEGIQSVSLESIHAFRILDPVLKRELRRALDLIAQSRRSDDKRVTIRFTGEGTRNVSIGYLLETAVWKTSYRLVLGEEESHFLQGWAIVENTTEVDWRDVKLTLVAGRPISFIMDLYRPIFVTRPTVQPKVYSSMAPQTYEQERRPSARSVQPAPEMSFAPMAADMYAEPMTSGAGISDFDEIDLGRGVQAAARSERAGEFFHYIIKDPITLPRKESAMVPIVNQPIGGERFGVYNYQSHPRHPFNALKLDNTTEVDLMSGPITVFEAGTYAGDSQIGSLNAGEKRFISFSLDLNTVIDTRSFAQPDKITSIGISAGAILSTTLSRREQTYSITGRNETKHKILIEHPITVGFILVQPATFEETTLNYYRFLAPEDGLLEVAEERTTERRTAVSSASDSTLRFYIQHEAATAGIKTALQTVIYMRLEINKTVQSRQDEEAKRNEIYREQARIRENMSKLEKDEPLYNRYVTTLDEQEDMLGTIFEQIAELTLVEREKRAALDEYITSLYVE